MFIVEKKIVTKIKFLFNVIVFLFITIFDKSPQISSVISTIISPLYDF